MTPAPSQPHVYNRFRLVVGKHSRWVVDHFEDHRAKTDTDIIENVTEKEMAILGGRVVPLDVEPKFAPSYTPAPPLDADTLPADVPESPVQLPAEPEPEPAPKPARTPKPKAEPLPAPEPEPEEEDAGDVGDVGDVGDESEDLDWPTIINENSVSVLLPLINQQDSPATLKLIEGIEKRNRNRVTVLKAVRARRLALGA